MIDKMLWYDKEDEPNCAVLKAGDGKKIAAVYELFNQWVLHIYVFDNMYVDLGRIRSIEAAKKEATRFIRDECRRRVEYYSNALELLPDIA